MAKAFFYFNTDTDTRKRGEQTGLDTLVVHAVNDVNYLLNNIFWKIFLIQKCIFSEKANALSWPPGDYDRKVKTQMNWRGLAQAVEHVV